METNKKEIEELGAVIFNKAEQVANAIQDYGVMIIACTDEKHKFLIFKATNDESSTARLGDAFIVDVPNISEKYEAREKKAEKEKQDEVRSV